MVEVVWFCGLPLYRAVGWVVGNFPGRCGPQLEENEIDGQALSLLSQEDLMDLGVPQQLCEAKHYVGESSARFQFNLCTSIIFIYSYFKTYHIIHIIYIIYIIYIYYLYIVHFAHVVVLNLILITLFCINVERALLSFILSRRSSWRFRSFFPSEVAPRATLHSLWLQLMLQPLEARLRQAL